MVAMTQQPFSRPGAIDLSALKRPTGQPGAAGPGATSPAPAGGAPAGSSAYAVTVDEQAFQSVLEASMTAPVVLVFYSRSRSPESGQLADDVTALSSEFEGRFLAGLVDVDANPGIVQAMQVPSVPLMLFLLDGRPVTQPIQSAVPLDQLREMLTQFFQQLSVQGVTARHQPRSAAPAETDAEDDEAAVDPRYAPAQEALGEGDIDRAVAEYQKLVDANPADAEAAAGLAMARVLQRTRGVDLDAARAAAAERPDDIEAQTMVADLDLLGGHVDDAFSRLIDLVRRSTGEERNRARLHLIELFGVVGNEDQRVLRGRQNLASALF
jgi:putative thioredoxin